VGEQWELKEKAAIAKAIAAFFSKFIDLHVKSYSRIR
jgi:hypothetical protein